MLSPAVKKGTSSPLYMTTVLLLLIAIVSLTLLCAYKIVMSQSSMITPQDMEIKRLSNLVEQLPNDINARLALAYSYQQKGDYKTATKLYNDVLKIDNKNLACLYNLARIDINQNKHNDAEQKLKKVLSLKSSHVLSSLALGELYIKQKRYDEAIKVLDMSIKVSPELVNPRLLKGRALELKGNKKEAIQQYKEVLKYIPDQSEALASLKKLNQ